MARAPSPAARKSRDSDPSATSGAEPTRLPRRPQDARAPRALGSAGPPAPRAQGPRRRTTIDDAGRAAARRARHRRCARGRRDRADRDRRCASAASCACGCRSSAPASPSDDREARRRRGVRRHRRRCAARSGAGNDVCAAATPSPTIASSSVSTGISSRRASRVTRHHQGADREAPIVMKRWPLRRDAGARAGRSVRAAAARVRHHPAARHHPRRIRLPRFRGDVAIVKGLSRASAIFRKIGPRSTSTSPGSSSRPASSTSTATPRRPRCRPPRTCSRRA